MITGKWMQWCLAVMLFFGCSAGPVHKVQTGSWGDQGDGTYRNPILNADYPDVDIEHVGDRYYMITSTVHYAPGMLLLESPDMVNWRMLGRVFDRMDWNPKYNWDRMAGYRAGVWAGDIVYHDGRWYCYFVDTSHGLVVSSAENITGPWAPAKVMLEKTAWTDPAAYWDEETGQAYLIVNFGKDHGKIPPGAGKPDNEQRVFKMSWDGLTLQDEGVPVYYGQGAEAAKIYRMNGEYYIFLAEWIDGDRKQLVLRGPSIYGPFDRKIVMELAEGSDRSVSQGALLQAPDGSWWLTHQLVQHRSNTAGGDAGRTSLQSFEGRSQWLVPVEWKDGWPVVGADPDGNGIGNTVAEARMPITGYPISAPQTNDEFSAPELSPQWAWNHNPRNSRWSLTEREGWLRLYSSKPVGNGGFWNAANTVSQRLMGKGDGMATAKIDLSGMQPGQVAGFSHHSGQYVLLGVQALENGGKQLFFDRDGARELGPKLSDNELWCRTQNSGRDAGFSYSMDGETWQNIGPDFTLTFGRWRGDRIGFFCWNDETDEKAGYIDINWFHYDEYDGPRSAKD